MEIGQPESVPQIEIVPLHDPIKRDKPREIPKEPEIAPTKPVRKRERVPA